MKKAMLLGFVLSVLVSSSLFAINLKLGARKENFGVKVGFASSTFSARLLPKDSYEERFSPESASGISLGVKSAYYPLSFNDKFQIHSELLFISKALRQTILNVGPVKLSNSQSATYRESTLLEVRSAVLEVPLLLNYQFSKAYGFRAYAGPYVSLALASTAKIEVSASLSSGSSRASASASVEGTSKAVNTFECGLASGLSYEWEKLAVDLRYETALTDYLSTVSGGKLQTLSVSGVYFF